MTLFNTLYTYSIYSCYCLSLFISISQMYTLFSLILLILLLIFLLFIGAIVLFLNPIFSSSINLFFKEYIIVIDHPTLKLSFTYSVIHLSCISIINILSCSSFIYFSNIINVLTAIIFIFLCHLLSCYIFTLSFPFFY